MLAVLERMAETVWGFLVCIRLVFATCNRLSFLLCCFLFLHPVCLDAGKSGRRCRSTDTTNFSLPLSSSSGCFLGFCGLTEGEHVTTTGTHDPGTVLTPTEWKENYTRDACDNSHTTLHSAATYSGSSKAGAVFSTRKSVVF
jgi:hypothetical protein